MRSSPGSWASCERRKPPWSSRDQEHASACSGSTSCATRSRRSTARVCSRERKTSWSRSALAWQTRTVWHMMRRRRTRRSPAATISTSAAARSHPSGNQRRHSTSIAAIDPTTKGIAERATELLYLAEDLAADVRTYRDAIDADPARLAVVEERLAEIRQLQRKYGSSIADILDHGRAAEEELERLTGSEVDTEALTAREDALSREVGELAAALSEKRPAVAESLAADVERSIARLNMGTAEFACHSIEWKTPAEFRFESRDGHVKRFLVDGSGMDRVTFLIAPNPGEALKPLSKIASGGETARLMLALKSILSEADQTPTLVFDEIDVGVGWTIGSGGWRDALVADEESPGDRHHASSRRSRRSGTSISRSPRSSGTAASYRLSTLSTIRRGSRNWRRCSTALPSRRAHCRAPPRCWSGL